MKTFMFFLFGIVVGVVLAFISRVIVCKIEKSCFDMDEKEQEQINN